MVHSRRSRPSLALQGSVYLEHLVLVLAVSIAAALGCVCLGLVLLHTHNEVETVLGLPIP
ncbi:MAG: hypothetical protein MUC50_10465 [Myxococcota bacterium]|nr:hypothetical protein [Myxococcota bacterium]